MLLSLRHALVLISLAIVNAPALAQPQTIATQIQLGVREAGKTYPLALNAQNADCKEPLDFRFTSNAAWLKLPADPVVRGVATGQTRALLATIDLTNTPPGHYQATVDVQCENCGWFIFQSCKIDKQQINFFLDVAPAAAPKPQPPGAAQQGGQNQPAPRAIDPNDPRLPPNVAKRLKKAYDDRDDAAGAKNPCEEELAKLAAAAKAAQDAADALNKQKADADQAAKEAAEKEKKAEQDRNAAGKALEEATKEAAEKAEFAKAMKGGTYEADAKKEAAEAEAKHQKAVDDLTKAQKALDEARKAAAAAKAAAGKAPSQAEVDAANKKAKAAQDALAKKEAECARAAADAKAKAQAEVEKAEKQARDALKAQRLAAEKELEAAKDNAQKCACHLAKLIIAQERAIKALIKLGAITGQQKSELKQWADKLREINELLRMLPDCPYKKLVETLLSVATFALDMLDYATPVINAELIPGTRSHTLGGDEAARKTKDFLEREKLTGDGVTADEIYEQMKNYAEPQPDSMKKLIDDLDAAKNDCDAAQARLERAEEAAAKASK